MINVDLKPKKSKSKKHRNSKNSFEEEKNRKEWVELIHVNTPCRFDEGVSHDEFTAVVHRVTGGINRIQSMRIEGADVYCTIVARSGLSNWKFRLNFNDWGHLTGAYWIYVENEDSSIPRHIACEIGKEIRQIYRQKNKEVQEYYYFIDADQDIGAKSDFSYHKSIRLRERIFKKKSRITAKYDSHWLENKHLFISLALLKNNGFKRIKAVPIKDFCNDGSNFLFEVEKIEVDGFSNFHAKDVLPVGTEIIIKYHDKKEITVSFNPRKFKGMNYKSVKNQLEKDGFTNITYRRLKKVKFGFFKSNGDVESVSVYNHGELVPISKNEPYNFDEEIVIEYYCC